MIAIPWQNGHSSEVLSLFDNTIKNIANEHQGGKLGGEQAELKV